MGFFLVEMMMADKASEYWLSSEDPSVDFDLNFDGPSMDIDDLLSIIEEKSDPPAQQVKFKFLLKIMNF